MKTPQYSSKTAGITESTENANTLVIRLKRHGEKGLSEIKRFGQKQLLNLKYREKITRIHRHLQTQAVLEPDLYHKHTALWGPLKKKVNPKWMEVYSQVSGIQSHAYAPEDIYYSTIEPLFNNYDRSQPLRDKNLYPKFFPAVGAHFPETLLMKINGGYYDGQYTKILMDEQALLKHLKHQTQIIVKPSIGSWGGKKVWLFTRLDEALVNQDGKRLSLALLDAAYGGDFIVQEYIRQHTSLQAFNASSLNTVRIFTYRSVINEEVIPLRAFLRVGKPGNVVDNTSSGGCAIGVEDGILGKYAVDRQGNTFQTIGGIDLSTKNVIRKFDAMHTVAQKAAQEHLFARLVGFDMSLDKEAKVRIIEINCYGLGINAHQMCSGPLFGEYTEEVAAYCASRLGDG